MTGLRPHVLELGMHFDPSRGGADRYFAGLLQGLESSDENFTAAAFGDLAVASEDSSRRSLGPDGMSLWKRWFALRKLGGHLPDSCAVVASHFALYALPLLGLLKNTAHVVHFHGPWAEESAGERQNPWVVWIKRLVERRVYDSADRFIVLSQAFRDVLIKGYGVPSRKIAVIPGGVDTTHFQPVDQREARRRMNWPEDKKIVFCVRRMVRRMGLENLIDAFGRVAAGQPNAVLILAGKGPLLAELQSRANAIGLPERIVFPGFIPDGDLPAAYSAADFSLVPSQSLEGFGLITLESLACGTPVLVTPVGGLPETVHPLDPSLVLAGCQVEDIARGLRYGFSHPLPSRDRCRDYVRSNFSWPVIARRVVSVYQEAAHDSLR